MIQINIGKKYGDNSINLSGSPLTIRKNQIL